MLKRTHFFVILLFSAVVVACTKPTPQLPANKDYDTENLQNSLKIVHQQINFHEDSVLTAYVKNSGTDFRKSESGFWYYSESKGTGAAIKENDKCHIVYKVLSMDDIQLNQISEDVVVGKNQTLNGIDEMLKQMYYGGKAYLILPSSLAYGMTGDGDKVGAYTPVKIELQVRK